VLDGRDGRAGMVVLDARTFEELARVGVHGETAVSTAS
jgi:hypothetical protein